MIDYGLLYKSTEYYKNKGYSITETPWIVDLDIMKITRPIEVYDDADFKIPFLDKYLVASAEQSFLQLLKNNEITNGKYQSITPCFRKEPVLNEYKQYYFMKNELIIINDVNYNNLISIIDDAFLFFSGHILDTRLLQVIKTDVGYDIEYNNIEIGSYGIRYCDHGNWIYGTGIAEPRFSKVRNLTNN